MGNSCCSNFRENDNKNIFFQNDIENFRKKFPIMTYDIGKFIYEINKIEGIKSNCCDSELIRID